MKRKTGKILALVLMGIFCMGVIYGCADDIAEYEDAESEEYEESQEAAEDEEEAKDEEAAESGSDESELVSDAEDDLSDDTDPGENPSDEENLREERDETNKRGTFGKQKGSSVLCFSGKDVNGNEIDTTDEFAKNKVTVVNMWASWCNPCVGEIPELEELNGELKKKECGVIGILIDGEDPDGLKDGKEILDYMEVTYLNVIGSDSMWDELKLEGVPTTFFVDSDGNILGDPVIGADPDQYPKRVDELLADM